MPVKSIGIKEITVFAIECPKKDTVVYTGRMVRIGTCRSCRYYCGEHGGGYGYVECSYEEKNKVDQEKLLEILRRHNSEIDKLARDCRKER